MLFPCNLARYQGFMSTTYIMPRAGLQYRFTDDTQSYLTIARGFKSGGFNPAYVQAGQRLAYNNENLMSYELGLKSDLIKSHLNLNAAVFYIGLHNQQVQTVEAGASGNLTTFPIANAPKSRSYGGELTLNARFDDHWSGYAGIGYADATYRDFPNAQSATGITDASGKQQQYISRFTGNIGAAYSWNIGLDNLKGRVDVGYQYRSSYYFDAANSQQQPGFGLLNARISAGNEHYQIYLWGNNLTNQRYRAAETNLGFGNIIAQADLRTFGVGINAKF